MKTLFVTDLDGTLLGLDAALAPKDAACINRMTADGIPIAFATARTIESVRHILKDIRFRPGMPPAALMNGVLLRDMEKGVYIDRAVFSKETADCLLWTMESLGAYPFIYALQQQQHPKTMQACEQLMTYYKEIPNPAMQAFMDERIQRYQKPFRQIRKVSEIDGEIIYFCLVAPEDIVKKTEQAICTVPHIKYTSYRDHYDQSVFYLEIFDERASKKHAIEFLRTYTGAETVVCFGDNLNDLPMFEASDIRVAAEGAHPELKEKADFIAHDGVPAFILQYLKNQ